MNHKFQYLNAQPHNPFDLVIESERLRLIPIDQAFDQEVFREFSSEVTQYMFPKPARHLAETREFIAQSRQKMQAGHDLVMVILLKPQPEFLGCCGLHGEANPRTPELGIWLKKSAHGNGYGREAIRALVAWAKQNLRLDYLVYPVDRRNLASRKIPESLGGKVVGECTEVGLAGNVLEEVVYRIE